MPPTDSLIDFYESPDLYGFGSTHLLIVSHRMVDCMPTADIVRVAQDAEADSRPKFFCEISQLQYAGPDQLLQDMGITDPVKFISGEALAWSKRGLMMRIRDRCRNANTPIPADVELTQGDWRRSFRLMRLRGLCDRAVDQIRAVLSTDETKGFFKDLRFTMKPLGFQHRLINQP